MLTNIVEVKVNPPVGTVVLNRPDEGNSVNRPMIDELRQAISDLHQEKRVRAVILTGAGDTFCEGRDLSEMAADHDDDSIGDADRHQRWGEDADDLCDLVRELLDFPKPIISAANGPVVGFGIALLMTSDIVLGSNGASISVVEPQYGMVAGLVTPLLAYRTTASVAARLAVLGQVLDAADAERLGIYHELVPVDLLWARAMEIGMQASKGAPQAVGLTKRLLMETVGEKLLTDLSSGAIASATARTTAAAEEGLRAYTEGRKPNWD